MASFNHYLSLVDQVESVKVKRPADSGKLAGSFNEYLPLLQQVEGGFQKNPDDPGNYNSKGELAGTNFGISARFYEGIIGRPPTGRDMKAITKEQAAHIFQVYFWDAQRATEIKSQAVANTIIDHHVNSGSGARLAQQVLNSHFGYSLAVDNQIGNMTLAAINNVDPARFVRLYNEARANYYRLIGNETFVDGWLKRLQRFAYQNQGISLLAMVTLTVAGVLIYQHLKA